MWEKNETVWSQWSGRVSPVRKAPAAGSRAPGPGSCALGPVPFRNPPAIGRTGPLHVARNQRHRSEIKMEPAISRVLSGTVIHLGRTSPSASSGLPGNRAGHAIVPLFGLAPGGVCRAAECCHRRGALLPHPFTLAIHEEWRSALCCTFRRLAPPRRYLAPCPVEPGLSSPAEAGATVWPTPVPILSPCSVVGVNHG